MIYSFATVQSALAKVHGLDERSMSALRGRIQNLQKLGLTPGKPGKGNRIGYMDDDVFKWAFALELSELGMGPRAIKDFIFTYYHWQGILWCFQKNDEPEKGDRLFIFDPKILRRLSDEEQNLSMRLVYESDFGRETLEYFKGRMVVINGSALRRQLEEAFRSLLGSDRMPMHSLTGN